MELTHSSYSFDRNLLAQSAGAVEYTAASLQRGKTPPPRNECLGYDTKQSDGEVPAMLELWGMWSIPSLPSLPGFYFKLLEKLANLPSL